MKRILIVVLIIFLLVNVFLFIKFGFSGKKTQTISPKKDITLSIASFSPVQQGNMFKEPVVQQGQDFALFFVQGKIMDIAKSGDQTYIAVSKNDGQVIKEVVAVEQDLSIT